MTAGRSRAEKVGRLKYIIRRLNAIWDRLANIETDLRVLRHGLREFLSFDRPYAERILEPTDLDEAIIQLLLESPGGVLPSVLAKDLKARGISRVDRWKVSARIRRMNRLLKKELGRRGFEKRGHRWAMTRFFQEIWGPGAEEPEEGEPSKWEI